MRYCKMCRKTETQTSPVKIYIVYNNQEFDQCIKDGTFLKLLWLQISFKWKFPKKNVSLHQKGMWNLLEPSFTTLTFNWTNFKLKHSVGFSKVIHILTPFWNCVTQLAFCAATDLFRVTHTVSEITVISSQVLERRSITYFFPMNKKVSHNMQLKESVEWRKTHF